MDVLQKSGRYSVKELIGINKVRQHLRVLTLSDIADLRGKRVLQAIKSASGLTNIRDTNFDFMPQKPLKEWQVLWRNNVCVFLSRYLSANSLGGWVKESHQVWKWKTNKTCTKLSDGTNIYEKVAGSFVRKSNQIGNINTNDWMNADVGFTRRNRPYVIASQSRTEQNEIEDVMESRESEQNTFRKYEK